MLAVNRSKLPRMTAHCCGKPRARCIPHARSLGHPRERRDVAAELVVIDMAHRPAWRIVLVMHRHALTPAGCGRVALLVTEPLALRVAELVGVAIFLEKHARAVARDIRIGRDRNAQVAHLAGRNLEPTVPGIGVKRIACHCAPCSSCRSTTPRQCKQYRPAHRKHKSHPQKSDGSSISPCAATSSSATSPGAHRPSLDAHRDNSRTYLTIAARATPDPIALEPREPQRFPRALDKNRANALASEPARMPPTRADRSAPTAHPIPQMTSASPHARREPRQAAPTRQPPASPAPHSPAHALLLPNAPRQHPARTRTTPRPRSSPPRQRPRPPTARRQHQPFRSPTSFRLGAGGKPAPASTRGESEAAAGASPSGCTHARGCARLLNAPADEPPARSSRVAWSARQQRRARERCEGARAMRRGHPDGERDATPPARDSSVKPEA